MENTTMQTNTAAIAATLTGPISDSDAAFVAESDTRLGQLRQRVRQIKDAKVDAVASTKALTPVVVRNDNTPGRVLLRAPQGHMLDIGDVAHQQFGQLFKIDKRYYDRLLAPENAELLAQNLAWWLTNTPSERLLRMLRPAALDATEAAIVGHAGAALRIRGVLGKGYRTIDDADLVEAILPTLVDKGAQLVDFSIDERRMHAKFATPPRSVEQIRDAYALQYGLTAEQVKRHTMVNGRDVSWVNEVISQGVTIRHSEVGFASLGAMFFQRVLKCLNDYVADNAIAIRHVGGKNGGADEDVRFPSDATQLMENAALLGRVTDGIAKEFDDKHVFDAAHKLLAAKAENVERPADMPLFEFVGNVGANLGFTQAQSEQLKEETVKAIAEEGGEVKFAFVQGITAVARQMTDYDARLDAERIGFTLLNDDAGELLKLGRDVTAKRRTFATA